MSRRWTARSRRARCTIAALSAVAGVRRAAANAWNGTDPGASAISANGLTDNYGQFVNESVVTNTQQGEYGTGTYLGNGWMLTALHVVSGGTYGVTVPGSSIQVNVYGQNYAVDQYGGFGSSDIEMIHLAGYTSGPAANLVGVERSQIYTGSGENGSLMQIGGFGLNGLLNSGSDTNNETFHRGFNLGSAGGGTITTYANGSTRLVQGGYLLTYQQGGDSGSGLWMDNGPDQDLDLRDWSLIGACDTGTTPGYFGNSGGYARVSSYAGGIVSTVFPHAWLTWNANNASATATDGPGTWDLTTARFTDGTNYAYNGPERTQQVTFGAGTGTAGTVTLGATVPVDQLVFNAAGSGTYTIAGSGSNVIALGAGAVITANANATISANMVGGTSGQYGAVNEVTKAGPATLTLTGQTSLNGGAVARFRAGSTVIPSGGSFATTNAWTSVGVYTGDSATLTLQGTGTYTAAGQDFNLGDVGGTGLLTVQDTAALTVGQLYVGKGSGGYTGSGGTGYVRQAGGTVTATNLVSLATNNANSAGTYNLAAGVLLTGGISGGLGNSVFQFNGGTLRATTASTALLQQLTAATVGAAGATIDTNGYTSTVAQPLVSGTGGADGGLTKVGGGTLILGGANTYTGPTTVAAGYVKLSPAAGAANNVLPVASYSFDNVSGSTVVNGGTGGAAMNGSLVGGATIVPGGRFGNAVSLSNGASVNVSSGIVDTSGYGNWTVSAWVKTTTAGSSILTKGDGSTWTWDDSVLYLGNGNAGGSGGLPSAVRYGRGFFQAAPSTPNVADGSWHLVTYVDRSGSYSIYTDGQPVALSTGNAGFVAAQDPNGVVRLGVTTDSYGDGTVNFNGLLDEVQFYGQGLNAAQVQSLYQTDTPNPAAATNVLPTTTVLTVAANAYLTADPGVSQTVAALNGPVGSRVALNGGTLTLNVAGSAAFAGVISGTENLVKSGPGTQTLGGTDLYTGTTTVLAGTLNLGANPNAGLFRRTTAGAITVAPAATLRLGTPSAPANRTLLVVPALTLGGSAGNWTATFDLGGNDLDVRNGNLAALTDQARQGYAGGTFAGAGLTSSAAAAADPRHLTALGVIPNAIAGGSPIYGTANPFDGYAPAATDVLVKYTYFGDANLDGKVDGQDYALIDAGYLSGGTLTGWYDGDFNYDGRVDASDYTLIDNAFNEQGASLSPSIVAAGTAEVAPAAVPEPTAVAWAAAVAVGLLGRRRWVSTENRRLP